MMKHVSRLHILLMVAIMVALAGCRHGSPLEDAIRKAYVSGDTTAACYDSLCALVQANPQRYAQYLDAAGHADNAALATLVTRIGGDLRPPMNWNIAPYGLRNLSLTIYFERSGSMVPYDTPGGRGQLKQTVNNLINRFAGDPDKVEIKIVNDDIYPYGGNVDDFLRERDIYAATAGTGNAAYTDFGRIFDAVLSRRRQGNVSVIVTDLIYSPADTRDVSVQKIFNEENSLATRVFKGRDDITVVVYRLTGDFSGRYYPYNNNAFDYRGQRPFFLLLITDTATYDAMAGDARYARFLRPDNVVNSYRFNQPATDVAFCLLPDWPDNAGRFRPDHHDSSHLTKVAPDKTTGQIRFTIAANLAPTGKDNAFLTDPQNYTVNARNDYRIEVAPIDPKDVGGNNKRYLMGKTHLITVTGAMKTPRDEVTITLRNDFPKWVEAMSTDSDTDPSAPHFATSTLGLEYFLRGLHDAFNPTDRYATITLRLDD